ncbi:MAG: FHA domain-containing protein, partial [Rhodospirillales bacterium]|nr:FHA domain-containing protein [Rhodospirillales bacterium]
MTLTLTVLRCPDAVPPETKQISGGEFRIGRGPDNDWIMQDSERLLSKRHCVIAFRNGGWAIADISTNGTYLNRDAEPVGNGQIRALHDGDRIRFGAYEIEARIEEAPGFGATGFGKGSSPFDDPFGGDVFAPPPVPSSSSFTSAAFGADDPLFGGAPRGPSVQLPGQFDPLAGAEDDFLGVPTQPDHTPSFSDA